MLRLYTFGGCSLARDGARVDAISGQRKALALLALLAAAGSRGLSREELLAYLWPESNDERARTSLRQLVHALRAQLAEPELLVPSPELRVNPAVLTSDVADFRDAVRRGDHGRAVVLQPGPFLEGFYLRGTDAFERWVAAERSDLAHARVRSLEVLAEAASARGDARDAVDWWRQWAAAEPLSARAATGLMRALDDAGERPSALRHARIYEALVLQEVGGTPDPSVMELARQLRRAPASHSDTASVAQLPAPSALDPAPYESDAARVPTTVTRPASGASGRRLTTAHIVLAVGAVMLAVLGVALGSGARTAATAAVSTAATSSEVMPSVAVLPFSNGSGDPADLPFTDGLTDEVISAIARVPGLRVTGRTSAFALRDAQLDARSLGDTLGVEHLVEGSVRRAGSRVRISVQLIGVRDGYQLWAESYDREVEDVFTVQQEIARAIVGALRGRLDPDAVPRVRPATDDPAAYELYLKGRYVFSTRTGRDDIVQAARFFEDAIARDPAFSRAHSGRSDAYTRLAVFGYAEPREAFAIATRAARRALELDSSSAEAHASLGHVLYVSEFAWAEAEQAFRRALALDPGYTFASAPFAIGLASQGRFDEAAELLERARVTDPLSPPLGTVLGRVYLSAGRPDDAIRTLRQVLEINPQMDLAHQQLGHAYIQTGRQAEGLAALRRAAVLSGARDSAQLAYALAVTGDRAAAERIIGELVAPGRPAPPLPYHLAMAYAGLGDADAAFRWLERGYEQRASFMVGVKVEPGFARLHDDPRWAELLARMGLDP